MRGPGGAVFLAAEAGGAEALDVGVGARVLGGRAGWRLAPDDPDPIELGEVDDGGDEVARLEAQVAHQRPQPHRAAAAVDVAEDVAPLARGTGGFDGIVGHGPELSAASVRGDKVARYSRRCCDGGDKFLRLMM